MEPVRISEFTPYPRRVAEARELRNRRVREQGGRCALCGLVFADDPPKLRPVLDHDHENSRARSALCQGCNTRLAWVESDRFRGTRRKPSLEIVRYLRSHGSAVPEVESGEVADNVLVCLPLGMRAALEELANQHGRSLATEIEWALYDHLEEHMKRESQSQKERGE